MLIYNAKIVTCDEQNTVYDNGFIGFDGDRIALVGDMADCPPILANEDFDAKSGTVYPGFIDIHCHLGLFGDSLGYEGWDANEITDPVTPQLCALDSVNPQDIGFAEAAQAGVTSVVTGVGSANAVGGQMIAMKTAGSPVADRLVIRAPLAIKMALGENPKRCYGKESKTPQTRMATAALIREALTKAQRYADDKCKAEQIVTDNNSKNGKPTENKVSPPPFDAKCEALLPLLRGEIPAHIHCHRADDIATALRIVNEFGLKYVLVHATGGHEIADTLAAEHAPCVIGPVMLTRSKPELSHSKAQTAAILHKAGVRFAICTDHPEVPIEYLALSAGVCVRGGLPEAAALHAITDVAAKIAGIYDKVGSLSVGKDADITVFPAGSRFFDVTAVPDLVVIDGRVVK
jgi:imidazolonepropionase-like amidohydrolase